MREIDGLGNPAARFPDDGILGEEGAHRESRNGRKWIVDPIDGTRDFVRGLPFWAVLIGLEVDGEVVVGVTHMAAQPSMYHAVKGGGAFCNDRPISISGIDGPSNALACINGLNNVTGVPMGIKVLPWMDQFWAVRSLGGCMDAMMRRLGSRRSLVGCTREGVGSRGDQADSGRSGRVSAISTEGTASMAGMAWRMCLFEAGRTGSTSMRLQRQARPRNGRTWVHRK